MLTLYHAPMTRSARIVWLLEELGLPYRLETLTFVPPQRPFSQATPAGKFPALVDGDLTMFESGAILEYVLERYGEGRLAPPPGTAARGLYLQWIHFAEGTAAPPIGDIVRQMFKPESERVPAVVEDARERARVTLDVAERALAGRPYLLGSEFSAADIMMGYTVALARFVGALDAAIHPGLAAYLERLETRPACQKAFARP